jgi:hypothetical protein
MFSSNNIPPNDTDLQDEKKSSQYIAHQFIEEEKKSDQNFVNQLVLNLEKEANANNLDKDIAQQVCQKLKEVGSLHDIVSVVMLLLTIKKCTHQMQAETVDELRKKVIAGANNLDAIYAVFNQMETEILLQSVSLHAEIDDIDDEEFKDVPLEALSLPNVFTPNILPEPTPDTATSSWAPASVTHITNQLTRTFSAFFAPVNRAPQQTAPAASQSDGMLRRYRGVNVSR